jgi:serine/threonine protein kinase
MISFPLAKLAYTTKITEKCDVYSFGVLTLEVVNGKHPGDRISDLTSRGAEGIQLKVFLDERLSSPAPEVEVVLTSIIKIATACLCTDPQSRPTMNMISNLLSDTASLQHLGEYH